LKQEAFQLKAVLASSWDFVAAVSTWLATDTC
jgi:hypothetical protein